MKEAIERDSAEARLRRHLVIADFAGIDLVLKRVDSLPSNGIVSGIFLLGDYPSALDRRIQKVDHADLPHILAEQKMGTRLYLAGNWETVESVAERAMEAGFTEQEMEIHGIDTPPVRLFCPKCYGVQQLDKYPSPSACCPQCGVSLDISQHYSRRWKAYLGFIRLT